MPYCIMLLFEQIHSAPGIGEIGVQVKHYFFYIEPLSYLQFTYKHLIVLIYGDITDKYHWITCVIS